MLLLFLNTHKYYNLKPSQQIHIFFSFCMRCTFVLTSWIPGLCACECACLVWIVASHKHLCSISTVKHAECFSFYKQQVRKLYSNSELDLAYLICVSAPIFVLFVGGKKIPVNFVPRVSVPQTWDWCWSCIYNVKNSYVDLAVCCALRLFALPSCCRHHIVRLLN